MGVSVRHTLLKIEVDLESQLSRIQLSPTDIEEVVNLEVLKCPKEEDEEVVKLVVVVDDENNDITVMDPAITGYEPPKWAGRPPSGYHLDVAKDGKMFQKLMVDEKPYYLFGRNMNVTDFCIDHSSCSRVHAALVYHKHLARFFLTDLGSTHGSHIGNIRLEPHKPTQLPTDSSFHFGASTRIYTLREKPKSNGKQDSLEDEAAALPETEYELDNLTEFNTAHNRRICTIGITTEGGDIVQAATARKRKSVTFNEEEDVINPEDIDPTVGKFRNLIQSTIVIPSVQPSKRARLDDGGFIPGSSLSFLPRINPAPQTISQPSHLSPSSSSTASSSHFIKSLGITLPSIAPDLDRSASSSGSSVDFDNTSDYVSQNTSGGLYDDLVPDDDGTSSSKKKYAKEAWPGHHAHGAPLANF